MGPIRRQAELRKPPNLDRIVARARARRVRRRLVSSGALAIVVGMLAAVVASSRPQDAVVATEGGGTLVTCDGSPGPPFPLEAVDQPPGPAPGDGPIGAAFQEAIRTHTLPENGWVQLLQGDDVALWGTGSAPKLERSLSVVRDGDKWIAGALGPCTLRAYREGSRPATWAFDPANPATSEATTLHIFAADGDCTRDPPIADRLQNPIVDESSAEQVVITMWSEPRPPTHAVRGCPSLIGSVPRAALTIQLARPLRSRTVLDGTVVPPQPTCTLVMEACYPDDGPPSTSR